MRKLGEYKDTYDLTILIVDVDPNNLKLVCVHLTEVGYKVFKAGNGKEALKVLERKNVI